MVKELRDEILTLRKKGETYKGIRRVLKCSMSVISYHCRKAGLATGMNKPTDDEISEMRKLYGNGIGIMKIADITKRCKSTISKYIIEKRKRTRRLTVSQSVIGWRKRTKQKLVELLGGKCCKCGYNRSIQALEFHHKDPEEKDFNIGGKSWAFEKLKDEALKCMLVCSNCHKEIHAGIA